LGELARTLGLERPKAKFSGELIEAGVEGEKVLLLCPLTYMNYSGESVSAARDFYKLSGEDLLVICDDFNLPLGKLRFRARGSSGGQKGLEDIIRRLGTEEFGRLRIGIGSPPERCDPADYVLAPFTPEEIPVIQKAVAEAVEAAGMWVRKGIEYCMNRYN